MLLTASRDRESPRCPGGRSRWDWALLVGSGTPTQVEEPVPPNRKGRARRLSQFLPAVH
jgi:hypothetical protein